MITTSKDKRRSAITPMHSSAYKEPNPLVDRAAFVRDVRNSYPATLDYNQGVTVHKIARIIISLAFLAAISMAVAAQTEPVLDSASVPWYPALARQGGLEGTVKVAFTLRGHETTPSSVVVKSGHPLLSSAAMENVKTWRFQNPYAVDRNYETTFTYRLAGAESLTKKVSVTFDSFQQVEVVSSTAPATVARETE